MARRTVVLAALAVALCFQGAAVTQARTTLGQPADPALIERENIDISPDGAGLPPGSGNAERGQVVFTASCSQCHGAAITISPERWAYATSLFDYVRRAMPPTTRTKLPAPDVYAIVAYLLAKNGLIPERTTMNASSLPAVRMPRAKDFVPAR
jgi:mono/diheme cytochrome c family protein